MDGKKLKRLLELKRRLEKVKKGELAEARQERELAQSALEAAEQDQLQHIQALHGENLLSPDELADRARFIVLAGKVVDQKKQDVLQHDQRVSEAEEARIGATRDVKTFELLSERDKEEKRLVQKRLEQGAADEIAGSRRSMR